MKIKPLDRFLKDVKQLSKTDKENISDKELKEAFKELLDFKKDSPL